MIAAAPGKLVLSGAYSVLEGAPALVAAVDRFALADASREAELVTEEVREAVRRGELPRPVWFDAAHLRQPLPEGGSRKLGLGSSAAILAASAAACRLAAGEPDERLGERIFPGALASHRAAQGGGSGVDVAASCLGGVLACRIRGDDLEVARHELPSGLVIEAWMCPEAASTSAMLARVRAFAAAAPERYRAIMSAAKQAAELAVQEQRPAGFAASVGSQWEALRALGDGAGIAIVTRAVAELDELARLDGARFGPSGAGGGDIALYLGERRSPEHFRRRAAELGHVLIDLTVGAPGVRRVSDVGR